MKSEIGLWIDHRQAVIVDIETTDKITDRQIAAKVRQHFLAQSAAQTADTKQSN
jgi:hypothetical protein